MNLPPHVHAVASALRDAGGRALLVGGGVRDALLGRPYLDIDLEVYGLPVAELLPVLRRFGRVDEVGRSFGVLKLNPHGQHELDVSIPRTDSNAGPGHRGIAVVGDPFLSIEEAARRRDLTINAILFDPLTAEYLDPHGGRDDLAQRRLRAVDRETFLDDPLRALRAVQFAARLEFHADDELVELCAEASLHELPSERILGEWIKLLTLGTRPSVGLGLARSANIGARLFPGRVDDPSLDESLDRLAAWPHRDRARGWQLAAGLLVWLAATPDPAPTLDRLGLHKLEGYAVRREVLRAHNAATLPAATDRDLRWLSDCSEVLLGLSRRHAMGIDVSAALTRAAVLGVLRQPPTPLLSGGDLTRLGVLPGPALGELLRRIYAAQLDGSICSHDQALDLARDHLP